MSEMMDHHEAMILKAETNAKKGIKGGDCNVTQCQEPDSAFYFNKSTRKYYCAHCANEINKVNRRDCLELYGVRDLCELDPEEEMPAPVPNPPLSKSQHKKEMARQYNERYDAEQARWNSLTKEEQTRELVRQGVNSAIKSLKPQMDKFLGR